MKMLSDCSGPCETCQIHLLGCGCLAGHGDDDYVHASPKWLAEQRAKIKPLSVLDVMIGSFQTYLQVSIKTEVEKGQLVSAQGVDYRVLEVETFCNMMCPPTPSSKVVRVRKIHVNDTDHRRAR
jgi:hypothetical protein